MRNRHILFAALPLVVLVSNCVLAQPFFLRKDIPVGAVPYLLVTGDFNGDGRPDLAVNTWEGTFILLNEGGGHFGRPIWNETAWPLVVGDFSGDGKDDLVTGGGVLLSRGDGTFLPPRPIGLVSQGLLSQGIPQAAGDFNRDGKIDLLVSDANGTRVLLGNGDGIFRSGPTITSLTADQAAQVVVADFNRDGRSDVAVARRLIMYPFPLLVFLGQGDGTFGPEIRPQISDTLVYAVADFNGDGLPDLAALSGIALGKGDGSFQQPVPYPSRGPGVFPVAFADITGDGKPDLVVGRDSANSISIYPGKGDGTFLPPAEQPVGWHPLAAVALDVDGDGRLDLVTVNFAGSNTVSVLLARAQGGPALRRAISAASDTAIVAPESLATLFAPTTATASANASPPWPTRLGGISLEVRDSAGATRLAPLLFVSPSQINFQVPAGTALGEATLAITSDRGATQGGSMQVDAVAPGLFMMSHADAVPAATGVRVEPDGTQVPVPVFSCSGTSCKVEPIPLSTADDRPIYLSFFGTGFRSANPENVTCSINSVRVPVLYAGPQGIPGLDQINVRLLPETLDDILLYGGGTIRINGVVANFASLNLR